MSHSLKSLIEGLWGPSEHIGPVAAIWMPTLSWRSWATVAPLHVLGARDAVDL